MDFCTNLTYEVQKGRGLGSRDPISKFWDPHNNFWTNGAIRFKFGADTEDGPVRYADFSGRGLGHVTQFRNFGTHYNFWRNRDIRFKFGTDIEDGPLRRVDHKTTPKWAWPGSRDPISKFRDPI